MRLCPWCICNAFGLPNVDGRGVSPSISRAMPSAGLWGTSTQTSLRLRKGFIGRRMAWPGLERDHISKGLSWRIHICYVPMHASNSSACFQSSVLWQLIPCEAVLCIVIIVCSGMIESGTCSRPWSFYEPALLQRHLLGARVQV